MPALGDLRQLVLPALGVLIVGCTGNVLTGRAFASRASAPIDANWELLALGAANIGVGVFRGFPISSSGSHTALGLPVVDEEDRLIGIATRGDLLRVFLRTDGEIRAQVIDEVLTRAKALPRDTVTVSVHNGMVTLEGRARHTDDIPLAVRSIWRMDGVIGVMSRLVLRADDSRPPGQPDSAPAHGA